MVKRKSLVTGMLGFLLVAGVIVVIVLAAMGYFSKKSGNTGTPTLPINTMGTTGSLVSPGAAYLSNFQRAGESVSFDVNAPCSATTVIPNCQTIVEAVFNYKGGDTKTLKKVVPSSGEQQIFYQFNCNNSIVSLVPGIACSQASEYPEFIVINAYNQVGDIKGQSYTTTWNVSSGN